MENLQAITDLAKNLPEAVRANALDLIERMGSKIEGIGDQDISWKPPFIRLVQGTTDRTSIPKGTAIGDIVLGEKKLPTPYPFIPLRIWDARTYWDPDPSSKRILCSSPDAKVGAFGVECRKCPHSVWKEGEGSACGKTKNMLAISADLSEVFTNSFSKSGYKAGMEFEAMLQKAMVPPYARVYALSSETSKTAKSVEVFKVEPLAADKRRTPEEHLPFLKELFKSVSDNRRELISKFYENVEARKATAIGHSAAPQIAGPGVESSGADVTLAVEASDSAADDAVKYQL